MNKVSLPLQEKELTVFVAIRLTAYFSDDISGDVKKKNVTFFFDICVRSDLLYKFQIKQYIIIGLMQK